MPTLTTSFGGGTSTAYIDLTACNSVLVNHTLNYASWTSATTINRQIAILIATKTIDAIRWLGARYYEESYNQALAFPRTSQAIPTRLWGLAESDMLSAQQTTLERACAFQALYTLAHSGSTLHRDNIRDGVGAYSYTLGGALSESWNYGGSQAGPVAGQWMSLCEEARTELAQYHRGPRLVRA